MSGTGSGRFSAEQLRSRRSSLSPAKRELLDRILRGEPAAAVARDPAGGDGAPGERTTAPLSFSQERLWFLDQLLPGNPVYNIAVGVRLSGEMRLDALVWSLNRIVARHQALRTSIRVEGGTPVQRIAPTFRLGCRVCDLGGLPAAHREREARRLAHEEARRPFELASGPLFRARVLRLSAGEHAALLTMHHAVADGWSVGVLIRELSDHYRARVEGARERLPELPVQYGDFAERQRTWAASPAFERELTYWRRRLDGAPGSLDLPVDRPRPAVQSHRGATRRAVLPEGPVADLEALARGEQATQFMVVVALVHGLVLHLTGAVDQVFGTPIAGRTRREYEGLIGFFANTVVLRNEVAGGAGFHELLRRVRNTALEAYEHQQLPFERLVEEVRPERSTARSPLFQIMVILDNAVPEGLALPGLRTGIIESDYGAAKFDLTFTFRRLDEGLAVALEYSTDLFDATTARRLLRWIGALAEGVARDPRLPIGHHTLLSEQERHQLVREWNDTGRRRAGATLRDVLRRAATARPDTVAVEFEERHVSYGALRSRVLELARALAAHGVGPDVPVGVALERSPALVVSLAAVVEAGGAFLPLDPDQPVRRLEAMVEDASPALVLVAAGGDRPAPFHGVPCVALTADGCLAGPAPPGRRRAAGPTTASAAYVIYTSGSTGRPKGVVNTHGGIVNRLAWMQERYRLGPDDRVLQKTPCGFDVSVWEFFWPLMEGARLVVARPGGQVDPVYLAQRIQASRVTTIHFVPSMLEAFLESREAWGCTSLVRVVTSGESLSPEHVRRLLGGLRTELHNLYGPTEAAVDVTSEPCSLPLDGGRVSIGSPIANTSVVLTDPGLRPAPPGVTGELCIGGANLARGYLGWPSLTATSFVPAPWGPPGGRVYRTGDLARLRGDGRIEFLGRRDAQVKVRGVRIELGEVEAALKALPDVGAAAAAVRETGGERLLVGYVVPAPGRKPELERLRSRLAASLPDQLVPTVLVELDAIPTTPSGKIDRKALPAPSGERPGLARAFAPPREGVEEAIAETWRDVLGVDRVGRCDNFFDLGGHSLRLVRVRERIRARLGRDVAILDLLRYPTVEALARFLEAGRGAAGSAVEEVDRRRDAQLEGRDRLRQRLRRRAG